jgi:hypothetical protein
MMSPAQLDSPARNSSIGVLAPPLYKPFGEQSKGFSYCGNGDF